MYGYLLCPRDIWALIIGLRRLVFLGEEDSKNVGDGRGIYLSSLLHVVAFSSDTQSACVGVAFVTRGNRDGSR